MKLEKVGSNVIALYNKIFKIGSIDKRSLALSRILLSCIIIFDLLNRLRWLKAHYTDEGIFPRSLIIQEFYYEYWFSFHFLTGRGWLEVGIFIVHIIFTVSFLVGLKTRLCNFVVWLFYCSLQTRNILVLHGGDVILRLTLFYLIFLPCGDYCSVDSVLKHAKNLSNNKIKRKVVRVSNFCSIALILQFCLMYYWNYVNKSGDTWHVNGMAPYYALQLDYFRTFIGEFILYITPMWFYPISTYLVLWIEAFGFILFFMPFYSDEFRLLGTFLFMGLHFMFSTSLAIEIFGWTCIFGLVSFLPPLFWDKFFNLIRKSPPQVHIIFSTNKFDLCLASFCMQILQIPVSNFSIVLNTNESKWRVRSTKDEQFLTKFDSIVMIIKESYFFFIAPIFSFKLIYYICNYLFAIYQSKSLENQPQKSTTKGEIYKEFLPVSVTNIIQSPSFKFYTKRKNLFMLFSNIFVIYTIVWSYTYCDAESKNFSYFPPYYEIGNALRLDQRWAMFAPDPPQAQYYMIIPALSQNGTMLEIFRNRGMFNWEGTPFSRDRGDTFRDDVGGHRWAKIYESMFGHAKREILVESFLQYVCREWNSRHHVGEKITDVAFEFHYQEQNLDGTRTPPKKYSYPPVQCIPRDDKKHFNLE